MNIDVELGFLTIMVVLEAFALVFAAYLATEIVNGYVAILVYTALFAIMYGWFLAALSVYKMLKFREKFNK